MVAKCSSTKHRRIVRHYKANFNKEKGGATMLQDCEFSIKSSYGEFLEGLKKVLPIRNPAGLISAVITRNFEWALKKGVPFEELFHEGVVALWSAYQDNELPLEEQESGFYWTRIRWFLLGYCRALFKEQAVPMSQLVSLDDEEEHETWLTDKILRDPSAHERVGSLDDLVEEIMWVVHEKGIQGQGGSGWKLRGNTEQKTRQILRYLAAGYNGVEIANMLGYKDEHGVNRPVAAIARKLREDEQFRELYGEYIPQEHPGRRPGGQFRGRTRATEEDLELAKASFRDLVPEEILEIAAKDISGE